MGDEVFDWVCCWTKWEQGDCGQGFASPARWDEDFVPGVVAGVPCLVSKERIIPMSAVTQMHRKEGDRR